jgi:DNA-binding Lrp family transcriptional regulator
MSYQALNWAWEIDLGLRKITEKFVLVALADMADENNSCFPGQAKIAGMVGCSVRTVSNTLAELESLELIERSRRHRNDGYRTSDRFFLQVGREPNMQRVHVKGTTPPTGNEQQPYMQRTTDLTCNEPGGNHQENHQREPSDTRSVIELAFEEFWKVYPRRKGRGDAFASFTKAVSKKGVDVGEILSGARRYAGDPNLPELGFVPYPATWLNQERWSDEPEAPRAVAGPPPKVTPTERTMGILGLAERMRRASEPRELEQ